ncbi:ATP-binding protein [Scytonema sp. NUACC21]
MNIRIHLKIHTSLSLYPDVLSWFEQINQPPLPDKKNFWHCQTLLIEGFTNIVEHAHKNLPTETPIEIEAVRSEKSIEIRIWAYGQPFNLEEKLQELGELEENEEERGRGLKIMAAIADKLEYQRTVDNRYCLFMCKYY